MWSRGGRELFFESLDNRIMVAGYTVQGDFFAADKPRLWSEKALANTINTSKNFDLASDGKRVVALMQAEVEPAVGQHAVGVRVGVGGGGLGEAEPLVEGDVRGVLRLEIAGQRLPSSSCQQGLQQS